MKSATQTQNAATEPQMGTLWWIADDNAELESWNLAKKGCRILDLQPYTEIFSPSLEGPNIDVFFELEKARALEILGYQPAEEEWLIPNVVDQSKPSMICVHADPKLAAELQLTEQATD